MTDDRRLIIIGSRESALAVAQSKLVMAYLEENHPEICVRLETMKTTGDKILERRLDEIGGKGLFVKELDQALRAGRIDLSVHSLKDMPAETAEDLPVIGFSKREDPRDVLVLPRNAEGRIDYSKPIGTSSKRRILQLQRLFPEARFESVRGNLNTRLRKLDEGQYSALILAAAGLKRLGLEDRIDRYFEPDEIIPSAGQGILSLQGRSGIDYRFLDGFCDLESAYAAGAERTFLSTLGGGCTAPVAANAAFSWKEGDGGEAVMTLRGFFFNEETRREYYRTVTADVRCEADCAETGRKLAEEIIDLMNEDEADR